MLTRGWRLASRISSQTSMPSSAQIIESSLAKAMFTSRKLFSVSFAISAVSVRGDDESPDEPPVQLAAAPSSAESCRRSPIVLHQLTQHGPGSTRSGQYRDADVRVLAAAPREAEVRPQPASQAAIRSVVPTGKIDFKHDEIAVLENRGE